MIASKTFIDTNLGLICVHERGSAGAPPVVFLHGIYLDSSLWNEVAADLHGHRLLLIDMPGHGESPDVGRKWVLSDCVAMLMQVLDTAGIAACVAVGHSWGAMTVLHAASLHPDRFDALCLFNMPFRRTVGLSRMGFQLQKFLAVFRDFYAAQAVKALYTPSFSSTHPRIVGEMKRRVAAMPRSAIAQLIDAVILDAGDARHLIVQLAVPAVFVVGQEDHVGKPPVECLVVPGGHISPHEAPAEAARAVARAADLRLARQTASL